MGPRSDDEPLPSLDPTNDLSPTDTLRIRVETRRYGRSVTIIEGFTRRADLHEIARRLKTMVAAGGSHGRGRIELQGDHRGRVRDALVTMGYDVSRTP